MRLVSNLFKFINPSKNTTKKDRFKFVFLEIINKINEIKKIESVFSNPEELKSLIPKDKHHKKGNKAIDMDVFKSQIINIIDKIIEIIDTKKYERITLPL